MKILKWGAIAVAAAFLVYASCFEIVSPDLFWHLKMGEDLIRRGSSPFVDHYSFTYKGAPIILVAWPFQLIIYGLYSLAGFGGIAIFRILVWFSGLYLLLQILRKFKIHALIQTTAVLFFLLVALFRSEPRPELLSLPLELLCLSLCLEWRGAGYTGARKVIELAALFFFWTNYHVSAVCGYVVLGGFLIERLAFLIFQRATRTRFLNYALGAAILVGVGFLNHDLIHPLLASRNLSPRWALYITDLATRPFAAQEPYLQSFWILTALSLPALLFKREWAGSVVVSAMMVTTWTTSKLFPHFIVMSLPFVCLSFEFYLEKLSHVRFRPGRVVVPTVMSLTSLLLIWQIIQVTVVHPMHPVRFGVSGAFFPLDTMEYVKKSGIKGRFIAEYGIGGYVLDSLAPDASVYIDPRTCILYPVDFMEHYTKLLSDPGILAEDTSKYDVNWILGALERPEELVDSALKSGMFGLEYVGEHSALLGRKSNRFIAATRLFLHPECLDLTAPAELDQELKAARADMPPGSPLISLLSLAQKAARGDERDYLQSPDFSVARSSYTARLAAFVATEKKAGSAALFYYAAIPNPNQDDRVNWAEADCEFNSCRDAEKILDSVKSTGLRIDHIYRAYKILERIRGSGGLKIFTENRFLRDQAKVADYLNGGTVPGRPDWCRASR